MYKRKLSYPKGSISYLFIGNFPISNIKNYHKFHDLSQTTDLLIYTLEVRNIKSVSKPVFLQETKEDNLFL